MNVEHPAEHEELLIAVLAGERAPEAREFQRLLATCPACRERWERARPIAARLARAGEDHRHALAAALAGDTAPGEDAVSATLADLVRSEPWKRPRSRRWLWLAAAGLVLATGLAWQAFRRAPTSGLPEDVPLGDDELRLIEPVGEVAAAAFERFRWEYDGVADGGFDLFFYPETESGQRGELLFAIPRWKTKEWTPDSAQRAQLSRRMRWEVHALDAAGEVVDRRSRSAWLR